MILIPLRCERPTLSRLTYFVPSLISHLFPQPPGVFHVPSPRDTARRRHRVALAGPAVDQDAGQPAEATSLDTVIVTGTRATDRAVLESTSPIDVLTAEDIRRAGAFERRAGADAAGARAVIQSLPPVQLRGADLVRPASCAD